MKSYIGIKQVQAEPMTRGAYNDYRGWTIPADENPEDDGYIVKYSDDYISWSPKKAFEEAYTEKGTNPLVESSLQMKSQDFKERFKAEYIQLTTRAAGLKAMLKKYKEGTLSFTPNCSYDLLHKQLVHMESYIQDLEERAKVENIDLEE